MQGRKAGMLVSSGGYTLVALACQGADGVQEPKEGVVHTHVHDRAVLLLGVLQRECSQDSLQQRHADGRNCAGAVSRSGLLPCPLEHVHVQAVETDEGILKQGAEALSAAFGAMQEGSGGALFALRQGRAQRGENLRDDLPLGGRRGDA